MFLRRLFFVILFSGLLSACAIPADLSTEAGRQAAIDQANMALTQGNCQLGQSDILPLFNSQYTDNEVRMVTASAYACSAKINLFNDLSNIVNNVSALENGFWSLMASLYPSAIGDPVVGAAQQTMHTLDTAINPGVVVAAANQLSSAPQYNPGSLLATDRDPSSDLYMVLVAAATIGALENRYGNPNPGTFTPGNALPWAQATQVDINGCTYASAVINMIDSLQVAVANTTGVAQVAFNTIYQLYEPLITQACETGCQGSAPAFGVASGCAGTPTNCTGCPMALRDYTQCKALTTDPTSCAAAGIVNFVNSTPIVGW